MLKLVFNRLAQGKLQQLRIFQQLFEQANCFGVIISVRNSLVYRKAKIYAVPHFKRAVLIEEGIVLPFAHHAEYGAGAPVGQVVITALQLYGAKVGQQRRGIIRVGAY